MLAVLKRLDRYLPEPRRLERCRDARLPPAVPAANESNRAGAKITKPNSGWIVVRLWRLNRSLDFSRGLRERGSDGMTGIDRAGTLSVHRRTGNGVTRVFEQRAGLRGTQRRMRLAHTCDDAAHDW